MRKQVHAFSSDDSSEGQGWMNLEQLAQVEVSSEESGYPIELAFMAGSAGYWQANQGGMQVIRLQFDEPVDLRLIRLKFTEEHTPRTQEFVLRWRASQQEAYQEVVRQQYTFSPPGTTQQLEQYAVELQQVMVLELKITPDISGGTARASLQELRLA